MEARRPLRRLLQWPRREMVIESVFMMESMRQAEAEVGGAQASSGDRRGVWLGSRVAMGRGSGTFERLLGNAAPAPRWERPPPPVLPGDRRATRARGGRADDVRPGCPGRRAWRRPIG